MARASFLHTADLHLSRPFGFLPPDIAEERRRDQRRVLNRIANLAIEREVNVILFAGDIFDTPEPDPTDAEAVIKELSRLVEAGKHVFVVPGNHDFVSPAQFARSIPVEGVHLFLQTEWSSIILEDLGIAVAGIAFDRSNMERRAFEGMKPPVGLPTIALVHASYQLFQGQLETYHPFSSDELPGTKASYVALGHYHRYNSVTANGVTACYPGTPEGISFDSAEIGERFVVVGEIGEDGKVILEPIKVNERTMRCIELDCTYFDSDASLFDAFRKACGPDILMEFKLTGALIPDLIPAIEEILPRFKESYFYLSVNTEALSITPNIFPEDLSIRGRFCKHILNQMNECSDPDQKKLLTRALELGLAAFQED